MEYQETKETLISRKQCVARASTYFFSITEAHGAVKVITLYFSWRTTRALCLAGFVHPETHRGTV
jgi:hypothetical protein